VSFAHSERFAGIRRSLFDYKVRGEPFGEPTRFRKSAVLLDAIYLSLHTISLAQYEKKASPIIADGGDNHSRHTESEIKNCDD
jgi:hypothetical protein